MNNLWKNSLLYALIGLMINIVAYLMGVSINALIVSFVLMFVSFSIFIYLMIQTKKEISGPINYAEGLKYVFILGLSHSLIFPTFEFIKNAYLDPDYYMQMQEFVSIGVMEWMEEALDQDMSEAKDLALDQLAPYGIGSYVGALFGALVWNGIFSLIAAIFMRRQPIE